MGQVADRALAVAEEWERLCGELREYLKNECAKRSQKDVAGELGISPQYLNDLVRGRREMSKQIVMKLRGKR